jgi:hypothetical protein
MSRPGVLLTFTIVLIGGLHLATIRAGHEWGDDFSLYVAHARNLAEGRDYAETGYIYNPHLPSLSPRTYPPIFPLLLVPVYAVFGLNLTAMKAYVVLMFMVFLAVLAVTLRQRLSTPYVFTCLLLVGLNPYIWQHKDRLLSEAPYLVFAYLALLVMEKALSTDPAPRRPWAWGLLAGALAYLAFGTRTVGIVLLPSLLICELLRSRRVSVVSLAAMTSFALGVLLQKLLLRLDGSYLDQLVLDPWLYARIAVTLGKAMALFFENGYSFAVQAVLFFVLLPLALVGFWCRVRERVSVYEPFVVLSLLLLTVWPFAEYQRRFLIPILPLFILYVFEGLQQLGKVAALRSLERPAAVTLALTALLSYGACYTQLDFGPVREGISSRDSVALFRYVRRRTDPKKDVFLFQKPRALALMTRCHASAHHVPDSDERLWQYLRKIGATHVILAVPFEHSYGVLRPFIERNADSFEAVFRNGAFTVYRIHESRLVAR